MMWLFTAANPILQTNATPSPKQGKRSVFFSIVGLIGAFSLLNSAVQAQGLIWNLPADGKWVRYEGTYSQISQQPDAKGGELKLDWQRKVTLKSVGADSAEFRGKTVQARWIEIKVETGRTVDDKFETGPGGVQLYKILVPEEAIRGELLENVIADRQVFISSIPVIKGSRKSGDQDAVAIETGVFQLYPTVALINHYPDLQVDGSQQDVTVPAGTFQSTVEIGKLVTETQSRRSTNECTVTRSAGIPFGVVKWSASTIIEEKGSTDLRSEFKPTVTIKEEMQAVAVEDGAQSELSN